MLTATGATIKRKYYLTKLLYSTALLDTHIRRTNFTIFPGINGVKMVFYNNLQTDSRLLNAARNC